MDSLEFNKGLAAVLATVLVIMGLGIASDAIYPEPKTEKLAYSVDVPEAAADGTVVEKEVISLATLMVTADAGKGERTFKQCVACHSIAKGGAHKVGPNLYGILGRELAATDYPSYSSAIKGAGGVWTYEKLDAWLKAPKAVIAGTTMAYGGLRKPEKRAELLAYLRSMSDAPLALPVEEVVEKAEEAAEDAQEVLEKAKDAAKDVGGQ